MMEVSKAKPRLWVPEELAEYLSVPFGWIYKRTRKHGPEMIPHIKLGKYFRFDPSSSAFQEWLARHESWEGASDGLTSVASDGLTLAFPVNRVRSTEKTGQILTKEGSVHGTR